MGTVKGLKRGLVVQLHIVLISHFHYSWSSCRLEELTLFTRPMLCLKAVLELTASVQITVTFGRHSA